ncbi:MAG TPA: hypothetical protein VGF13_07010 [Verrucomicrobiae bacterium]|jgi:hypothetical protein
MKTFQFRAPVSMKLHTMKSEEIEKYVAQQVDVALKAIPETLRPVGVNAVTIDSIAKGTAADPGVWAQWTRACCDKRKRIEDYKDITPGEMREIAQLRPVVAEHVETDFSIQVMNNPKMH